MEKADGDGYNKGEGLSRDMEVKWRSDGSADLEYYKRGSDVYQRHGYFPSGRSDDNLVEHFAETTAAYFLYKTWHQERQDTNECWADEDPACSEQFEYDRYDYMRNLIGGGG